MSLGLCEEAGMAEVGWWRGGMYKTQSFKVESKGLYLCSKIGILLKCLNEIWVLTFYELIQKHYIIK